MARSRETLSHVGQGPLSGIRVVEIAGIGPGPFAAMMLADLGAEVLRIVRPASVCSSSARASRAAGEVLNRGRRSAAIDLKHPDGIAAVLELVESADVLLEGFRPGVMERLGLGPSVCLERNPRLVYGRMTGWGQDGPMALAAGHDINYIALAGALHHIGRAGDKPTPPLNLVGDFGGGGMLLAFGITSALLERVTSGKGQVVDAAMLDGAAALMAMFYGAQSQGGWHDERGTNMLDSGAHFYDTYETKDGGFVALGAIEPQFYAELLDRIGLADEDLPDQNDEPAWPTLRDRFSEIFRTKTRGEWCALLEGSDACFAPVLSMSEAPQHPQAKARETFVEIDGVVQPAPAPRFSRTPGAISRGPSPAGTHTLEALSDWGFDEEKLQKLRDAGVIRQPTGDASA